MNRSSRRSFLQSMAAVSLGGALPGQWSALHAETFPELFGAQGGAGNLPLSDLGRVIFPKPQHIAASGSDFVLDDSVRIVVPEHASAEDAALALSLIHI